MTYQVAQIGVALSTAQGAAKAAATAEANAQAAIDAASTAQKAAQEAQSSADAAESDAQTGIAAAARAQAAAETAQSSANTAEADAQTGIKNAVTAQTRANLCVNGQYAVAGSPAQYGLGLVMGADGNPYFWYDQTTPTQLALVTTGSSPTFEAVTLSELLQLTPVPSSQISGMANAKAGMVMMSLDNGNLYYRGQDENWHQIATSGTL
ncbi:hypothetical protein IGS75_01450 [Gluconobacter sphaericus]|uniref:hypothetical protein n=1 Tax=Gluconobacter sphaericus TaxID=574987 RepID=UPI001921068A|nr:hypothetical protein [Gluconobacter sphaericus]QQX91336.1 hypothetical protein IGS75_01450 [Gluconobacter sphaericus]